MIGGAASRGFSLVEALVALAVIAAMSGLVFEAVAAQARAAAETARRREAILLAQSLVAAATAAGLPPAGRGRWQTLAWSTRTRPFAPATGAGPGLEEVLVEVRDAASGRRLTSVRTLRFSR